MGSEGRRWTAAFLGALLAVAPGAVAAQRAGADVARPQRVPAPERPSLDIGVTATPEALELVLSAPQTITKVRTPKADELVVDFEGRIEGAALLDLPRLHPAWVENVSYGYDSLLIVFTEPVQATIDRRASGLAVTLVRRSAQAAADGAPGDEAGTAAGAGPGDAPDGKAGESLTPERGLLRARYLRQVGRTEDARALLAELAGQHPHNVEVWRTLAEIDRQTGRWRRALDAYNAALMIATEDAGATAAAASAKDADGGGVKPVPQAGTVQRARWEILHERRPRLTVRPSVTLTEDTFIMATELGAFDYVSKRWEVGAATTPTYIDTDSYRRAGGATSGFSGLRHQAQLYARYHIPAGFDLTGTFYASGAGLGVGAAFQNPTPNGRWSAEARYNAPADRPVAARIQDGGLDELRARRDHRFDAANVSAGAALYARNYRLDGEDQLQSLGGEGGLFWTFYEAGPNLSAGYSFFAEYVQNQQERTDAAGTDYAPVDLDTSEVHSLQGEARWQLGRFNFVGGGLGYSLNRFGGNGPFAFANGRYRLHANWHIRGNASVGLTGRGTRQRDASLSLGTELVWHYAETPRDGLLDRLPQGWWGRW